MVLQPAVTYRLLTAVTYAQEVTATITYFGPTEGGEDERAKWSSDERGVILLVNMAGVRSKFT